MARHRWTIRAAALLGVVACGCAPSGTWTQSRNDRLRGDYAALVAENEQLRRRAGTLDSSNEQQIQQFAQQQRDALREAALAREQLAAVREQLTDATTRLNQLREEKLAADKKVEAMVASTRRGGGASITANRSLRQNLPAVNIPDVNVRADGEVVRIDVPADKLFPSGTAQLTPGAADLIDRVAAEVARAYPEQLVGVEGHTDNRAVQAAGWTSRHQLSLAQAVVVFNRLTATGRLKTEQLVVAGHGANHPIFSNAHPDGQARNRRIELVVYPDRVGD